MLENELWGNTIENWGISILIILGAIIIVKLLSLLGKKVIKPFVTGTDNHLDDVIFYSLEAPVKFAIILLGIWIAIHRLVYPDSFVKVVDNAYSILIVLDITWFFGRLFSSLLQVYWGKQSNGQANKMMPIIKRTILVIVWLIGIVMALYDKYIVWTDSVKALTAEDKLGALQQKYDQSLQTIQEKDDKLSVKQYMIVGLITFVVILIAALLFLGFLLLRFIVLNKKLKKIIQTTNEHSEQQAQFIQNISVQMEPTLNKLSASAKELQAVAPKQAEDVWTRVEALKQFTVHIQELSSLENTLMEPYEVSSFNVGNFSKKIVEKVKGDIQPEVNLVTDVPQLEIKTNAEHLEQVLLHLLKNAALYTSSGNIRLEFKRKGAHVCQFIITDNGTGIPDDLKENLFKPFNEAKDLAQGDGLGLPICALMASKLNGTLSIDKEYKKGCRFVLVLQI